MAPSSQWVSASLTGTFPTCDYFVRCVYCEWPVNMGSKRRRSMTMPAFAEELGARLPSANERAAANQLRQILAAHTTSDTKLRVLDEKTKEPCEITLTPALSSLLMELLRHVG